MSGGDSVEDENEAQEKASPERLEFCRHRESLIAILTAARREPFESDEVRKVFENEAREGILFRANCHMGRREALAEMKKVTARNCRFAALQSAAKRTREIIGNSKSAKVSRTAPSPNSSRVSFSAKRAITSAILRRSSSAKSTHVNIDEMALLPASNGLRHPSAPAACGLPEAQRNAGGR
jgi:hypothetical protein